MLHTYIKINIYIHTFIHTYTPSPAPEGGSEHEVAPLREEGSLQPHQPRGPRIVCVTLRGPHLRMPRARKARNQLVYILTYILTYLHTYIHNHRMYTN